MTSELDIMNGSAGDWLVLHTKPRQEEVVAEHLRGLSAYAYVPRVVQVRYYGKRKKKSDVPLFPSYVFMRGEREQAYSVDRARGIVQIIDPPDQAELGLELSNIQLAIERDAPLVACSYLERGTAVQVRSGPFKGMRGVVEQVRTADRIVLQIGTLGQALSLEIDGTLLERID